VRECNVKIYTKQYISHQTAVSSSVSSYNGEAIDMPVEKLSPVTRRSFLWRGLTIPASLLLASCGGRPLNEVLSGFSSATPPTQDATPAAEGLSGAQMLPPTPACGDDDDDDLTPAQAEGPFFTPNSPQRTSLLEAGMAGTPMLLTGYVLSTGCEPIPGALVDFWHADDSGVYDNAGYRLRGHQFTDEAGRYTLETIIPGLYPGRTRHFHVKVQAANQPVLTTQLYFPDEPINTRDGLFIPELLMEGQGDAGENRWAFNFVLAL
jgi:protocatechuate 3,4-dioxygenase beta subunit